MAVLLSLLGSIASAAKLEGYAAIIEGLPGGPPLAHWRLDEAGGTEITDRKGARHGTYSGTVGYGAAGLPQNSSNGAVDFAGTGSGSIPHDAGLELADFSLSFWFQVPAVPVDPDVVVLVSKDQSGRFEGDFVARVCGDGILLVQFQSATADFRLTSADDTIVAGQTYHVCVRADATGFDAYLDGQYLGKVTGFTGAWSSNQTTLSFAIGAAGVLGDCTLDEVALYPRVLTESEVLTLAQRSAAPVAVADTASVPESATTAINVLSNDSYAGAAPTLEIVSQPSGGDSVAVSGQEIDYTAGAVAADIARSFSYRITDPNGQSNTATVSVTVQNTSAPPPAASNANCFPATGASTVSIGSGSGNIATALANAVNAAPPGRHILIAAGTYTGGNAVLNPAGTAANPIVIRPQGGRGTVTINDANWDLANGSSRLVFWNLFFNNSFIDVNGSNHRITRCRFRQITAGNYVRVINATDTRVDHCDVSDWASTTAQKQWLQVASSAIDNGSMRRLLIDYCYIHDILPTIGANTTSAIELGKAGNYDNFPEIVVDHCLFNNIHIPKADGTGIGEPEVICIKCQGTVIRFCTFSGTFRAHIQMRNGGSTEVRSCWFGGTGAGQNAPLRMYHEPVANDFSPLIIGNRFLGSNNCWASGGNTETHTGAPDKFACRDGRFIGNRFTNGFLQVGAFEDNPAPFPARDNNLWNNTRDAGGDAHQLFPGAQTGTTLNQDNEAFVAAEELSPADVGLAAPDPLCPGGPQS